MITEYRVNGEPAGREAGGEWKFEWKIMADGSAL